MRPCLKPGCAELVQRGYCEAHAKRITATHGKTAARGYGHDWQKVRAAFIRKNPACERCLSLGKIARAEEVHHVVKIRDNPARRLDWSNLRALCRECHEIDERS